MLTDVFGNWLCSVGCNSKQKYVTVASSRYPLSRYETENDSKTFRTYAKKLTVWDKVFGLDYDVGCQFINFVIVCSIVS